MASSMELFHVSKFISVPIAAAIVWLVVVKGNYKSVEKVFLTASFFYIAYIIAGVLSRPNWPAAAVSTVRPPHEAALFHVPGYVYMVTGIIGATIAPWMQFYLQASVVEKGVTMRDYNKTKIDVLVGSIFAPLVAGFIILACAATLYKSGHRIITDAADAAQALGPLAGTWARILFGAGLFNASLFAASILPLSTAYTVCEGLGFESGLDKKFGEASFFLLAVYGAGRRGRCCYSAASIPAAQNAGALAGFQRSPAPLCADLYASADQQDQTDGKECKLHVL